MFLSPGLPSKWRQITERRKRSWIVVPGRYNNNNQPSSDDIRIFSVPDTVAHGATLPGWRTVERMGSAIGMEGTIKPFAVVPSERTPVGLARIFGGTERYLRIELRILQQQERLWEVPRVSGECLVSVRVHRTPNRVCLVI